MSLLKTLLDIDIPQQVNGGTITRKSSSNWMNEIFGFSDKYLIKGNQIEKMAQVKLLLNQNQYNYVDGTLTTKMGKYNAGWVIYPTIREIEITLADLDIIRGSPNISIIYGRDVGLAQSEAEDCEFFQGASQLNALEIINVDNTPFDGISNYINDGTQGPRTALACAPGTFIRNYWILDKLGCQFNALENMGIPHTNGYLLWGNNPKNILDHFDTSKLMIPCMIYTQVVGIHTNNGCWNTHITNKRIHQIYSSAAPVNAYSNSGNLDIQLEIAKKLIEAEYVGAIGISLLLHHIDYINKRTTREKAKINLTLIGAGVFNVPEDLVISLIQSALARYSGYSFDVYIHAYSKNTLDNIKRLTKYPKYSENTIKVVDDGNFGLNIDVNKWLLVFVNNGKLEVYKPHWYQQRMLQTALSFGNRNLTIDYISGQGNDSVKAIISINHKSECLDISFIDVNNNTKFFVNIDMDRRIGGIGIINDKYVLLDKHSNVITNWLN